MPKKTELKIVEGIAGVYHYHLSETGKNGEPALCGNKRVMLTSLPLASWGKVGHLREKYCKECRDLQLRREGILTSMIKGCPPAVPEDK
jgi:hypothetical protein